MFFFWRPKPQFGPGQLATFKADALNPGLRYMLMKRRWWAKPNGETKKRWVYGGDILEIVDGRLVLSAIGHCFPEDRFMQFFNIDIEL